MLLLLLIISLLAAVQACRDKSLETVEDSLDLVSDFIPLIPDLDRPHHARTPFAISEDGRTLHVAYVEGSRSIPSVEMSVHVQKLDPENFGPIGDACTIVGAMEASGLVSLNDGGFAILTTRHLNETDPTEHDIPVVERYRDCQLVWSRAVGGKTVPMLYSEESKSFTYYCSRRLDGDLAYSPKNSIYGAYFRVGYYGLWEGHGGDTVVYLDDSGDEGRIIPNEHNAQYITEPKTDINSSFSILQHNGHNYGAAIAASDEIPFATLSTGDTSEVNITSDMRIDGGKVVRVGHQAQADMFGGEAFGGVQGSYSVLTSASSSGSYLMAWATKPPAQEGFERIDNCNAPKDTCVTGWCGSNFRQCDDPALSRYVQVARLANKSTADHDPISLTSFRPGKDCFNVRVASFNDDTALVTWEEYDVEHCKILSGCAAQNYKATYFQLVDGFGNPTSEALGSADVFVSGDIIKIKDRLCWPYVNLNWASASNNTNKYPRDGFHGEGYETVRKLSFACIFA